MSSILVSSTWLLLTFNSGDEMTFGPSEPLVHPGVKRFPSYDDHFPDPSIPQYEQPLAEPALPENPSLDQENKLLGFCMPLYNFTLLDSMLRRTSLNMNAQLHGMFFLAECQWSTNPDAPPPPPELTCYRRNLFQITGSITVPRTMRYIMTDQGDRIPILAQELTVSATESVEGNAVKIISVPWKTPAGGAPAAAEEKSEKEPPAIQLDTMSAGEVDADYATFPIQWKRLQFRIATANNGRRKELQQHFVLHLKIMATLSTGPKISIAEAHSGAIIVRGRSPRNFVSRKDVPLSQSAGASRKALGAGVTRTSTGDSIPQIPQGKIVADEVPQVVFAQYENNGGLHSGTSEVGNWNTMGQHQIVAEPITTDFNGSIVPPQLSPYLPQSASMALPNPSLAALNPPINLSFNSDDEGSPVPRLAKPVKGRRGPTSNPSPSMPQAQVQRHQSQPLQSPSTATTSPVGLQNSSIPNTRPRFNSQQSVPSTNNQSDSRPSQKPKSASFAGPSSTPSASPSNTISPAAIALPSTSPANRTTSLTSTDPADVLYEYFPLGLDDWMPPVDAVYRPHLAQHGTGLGMTMATGIGLGSGIGGVGSVGMVGAVGGAGGGGRLKRYFGEDG